MPAGRCECSQDAARSPEQPLAPSPLQPLSADLRIYLSQFPLRAKEPIFLITYRGKSDWIVRVLHLSKSFIVNISFCEAAGWIKIVKKIGKKVQFITYIYVHAYTIYKKYLYWNSESIWFIWFSFLEYDLYLEWKVLVTCKRLQRREMKPKSSR